MVITTKITEDDYNEKSDLYKIYEIEIIDTKNKYNSHKCRYYTSNKLWPNDESFIPAKNEKIYLINFVNSVIKFVLAKNLACSNATYLARKKPPNQLLMLQTK
jgi:hypothetical protein